MGVPLVAGQGEFAASESPHRGLAPSAGANLALEPRLQEVQERGAPKGWCYHWYTPPRSTNRSRWNRMSAQAASIPSARMGRL